VPSNASTVMVPRPGSSQSIRPDSSMSSRGHSIPPVVIKKTRVPAQPRTEAPKPPRVRKKSPLNDSSTSATASTRESTMEPPSRSSSVVLPSIESSNSQTSDIDSLTAGMKKVKLNLTTKAQREAKEQAKQTSRAPSVKPAVKPAAKPGKPRSADNISSRGAILPPVPHPGQVLTSNGFPVASAPRPQPETLPPMPSTPQPSLPSHLPSHLQAADVPLPASSPPAPIQYQQPPPLQQGPPLPFSHPVPQTQTQPSTAASGPGIGADVFIPYQPEGPQQETTVIKQEPLKWLPPNTATPSGTPMKRADLPVWSSTGMIPFAGSKPNGGVAVKQEDKEKAKEVDISEVPETPRSRFA
jgi:histone deacetylase HOS3